MILVDTSIWINLLSRKPSFTVRDQDWAQFASCGPVVQEVLQGLRPGARSAAFSEALLAIPFLSDPIPLALYLSAGELYRLGRSKGLTIRSSVDCLIAAIAIENRTPVWHMDRDFTAIARYTTLQIAEPPRAQ